jgi:hypothetical protein
MTKVQTNKATDCRHQCTAKIKKKGVLYADLSARDVIKIISVGAVDQNLVHIEFRCFFSAQFILWIHR